MRKPTMTTTFEADSEVRTVNGQWAIVPNGLGGSTTVRTNDLRATGTPQVRPATERMISYLRDLVAQKTPQVDPAFTDHVIAQGFERVSAAITRLKAMPYAVPQAQSERVVVQAVVPAGHYAVPTDEGHLAFYRVDRPTEGRWAGRTFVKIQLGDSFDRIPAPVQAAVLAKIRKDPKAAMLAYGQEIGRCGHCNRTLTNELSRRLGIGPVCRESMGW